MPGLEASASLERGKSRGGTRGGKPTQSNNDVGLGGILGPGNNMPMNLDSELEKCDGSYAVTQTMLGELITRPKLSEKLLSKPPFRFLHDIITEVMKSTGFATGLYTPEEADSSLVTEKAQKITFLEKIIKLVGIQLNTLVEAKPSKIVAGLDANVTNNFLQLLAVAAKHVPDSTLAVRSVLSDGGGSSGGADNEKPAAMPAASAAVAAPVPSAPMGDDKKSEEKARAVRQVGKRES
jgi:TRAF3-interacting protein 1